MFNSLQALDFKPLLKKRLYGTETINVDINCKAYIFIQNVTKNQVDLAIEAQPINIYKMKHHRGFASLAFPTNGYLLSLLLQFTMII